MMKDNDPETSSQTQEEDEEHFFGIWNTKGSIFSIFEYVEKDPDEPLVILFDEVENVQEVIDKLPQYVARYFIEPTASRIIEAFKLFCVDFDSDKESLYIPWSDIKHEAFKPLIDEYYKDKILEWKKSATQEDDAYEDTFANHLELLRRWRMNCEEAFDLSIFQDNGEMEIMSTASGTSNDHVETGEPLFQHTMEPLDRAPTTSDDAFEEKVYQILCSKEKPPYGESLEKFLASRIAKLLNGRFE